MSSVVEQCAVLEEDYQPLEKTMLKKARLFFSALVVVLGECAVLEKGY